MRLTTCSLFRHGLPALLLLLAGICSGAEDLWQGVTLRTDNGTVLSQDPNVVRDSGPTMRWPAEAAASLHLTAPLTAVAKGLDLTLGYGERYPQVVRLAILGAAGEPLASFSLHPNGLGWRRLVVDFAADAEANQGTAAPKEIVITTPGWSGDLWIGSVAWLSKVPYRRSPDLYCPTIYHAARGPFVGDSKGLYAEGVREWLLAYESPVPTAAVTTLESGEVYRRYLDLILGQEGTSGPFATAAHAAQEKWMTGARQRLESLGLHRQGPWIVTAAGIQPTALEIRGLLTPVAMSYRRHPDPTVLEQLLLAFDGIHQAGLEVCNPAYGDDGSMLFVRLELANYAHAVGLLRDELAASGRLGRIHEILRWQSRAGEMDGEHRLEVNADSLRGEALPRLICALSAPDNAARVREIALFKTWLTDGLAVQASLHGFIKPDFSVNHHHNPYLAEYGPHGIQAAAMASWILAGTPWAMDKATLDRLEGCADTLVELSRGFTLPIGVRGRFPDTARVMINNLGTFLALADRTVFSGRHAQTAERLIQAAGVASTAEGLAELSVKLRLGWRGIGYIIAMADAVSELSQTAAQTAAQTAIPAAAPGLAIANWAGVANYRRNGWSAAVQGCSRWHFDFESGNFPLIENDWGRFIRYGTVELWSGSDTFDEDSSGLSLRKGWNWSRMPGATTLDLPAAELGLPTPPKPRRMRNFSEQGTCAGNAGPAGMGMFALDLQDTAYPGRLAAHKSVFFVGDQVLCLGSGISSNLSKTPVITTLFQFGMAEDAPASPGPATDTKVPAGTSLTDPAGNVFTLLSPAHVTRKQGLQEGPASNGRITKGRYDTAWIDHAATPKGAGYAYLIAPRVVGRTADRPAYEILQADATAHVVRFPGAKATAHILFAPVTARVGSILACNRPCLIWVSATDANRLEVRIVDPDLGCPDGNHIGDDAQSQPTNVQLDIPGRFTGEPGSSVSVDGERTRCSITCLAGQPTILNLQRIPMEKK